MESDPIWAVFGLICGFNLPSPETLMMVSIRRVALASSLIAAIAGVGAAQGPGGRPLAIEAYYRVKTIGNPVMSPDGKWVAFTASSRLAATNHNTSEVRVVRSRSSVREKRVGAENADAANPRRLDDGRHVDPSGGHSLAAT